ncbi:MAG: isopeptide-forming domain-containing fimbrial protein, partial [Solirubrobacteraceae bacterium]
MTVSDASVVKTVDKAQAPVGDTVIYTVTATLPANANFYDVRLGDKLPKGVEFVAAVGTPQFTGWGADPTPTVGGPSSDGNSAAGETLTWTLTPDDFSHRAADRTITVQYTAKITDDVETGTPTNVATLSWNSTNGDEDTRVTRTDDAVVTILDPQLSVQKDVRFNDSQGTTAWGQTAQGNPDRTLQYRVVVSNTSQTPAHNVTVTDCIPTGLVNVTGISHSGASGGATGACPGGTITWTGLGPIAVGGSVTLTYSANFAPAAQQTSNATGQGALRTNTASATHFESFPRDPADPDTVTGREYNPTNVQDTAQARPLFPRVTLAKSVTNGDIAYADTPFGWTLRATNTGRGALQNIEVRDTLPVNWSYTSTVTAQIRANGTGAWFDLAAPSGADGLNLTWSEAQIRTALGTAGTNPVLAGWPGSGANPYFEIRFSATPSQAALTTAGVTLGDGTRVPHTNTLQATATDTRGDTGNSSGSYVTNTSTADGYLHSADLTIAKVGVSAPIHAGSTNVLGWTVTVTNNGPDTAVGTSAKPIKVTDTTGPLPAGVTVSSVSGTGWTCDPAPFDRDPLTGETGFECVRTNAADTLAKDASFPAITVNVTVAADQPEVAANVILNTATVVPGATHDPNAGNNESTDDITIDNLADLTIAKTVVNPAPANVGDAIAWQIKAWNAGPSVSRADGTHPITVTDTIPAGVTGVTATGTANWAASATRSGAPVADLTALQAGDIVTWTYQGAQLPVGTQASADALTLNGTILTSHVGVLSNTATVTPGLTPEPTVNPLPNDSTVPVTPGSDTRLDVTKERVVPDGAGGWRPAGVGDVFVAGTDISYRITVENLGPADARDVQVVDEV